MDIPRGTTLPWFPLPRAWRQFASSHPDTVLLETAGGATADHLSFLYADPREVLCANTPADLPGFLARLDSALQSGAHVAGYFTYEAGAALHDTPPRPTSTPLAVAGIYPPPQVFDHNTGTTSGPGSPPPSCEPLSPPRATALLGPPALQLTRAAYANLFGSVQRHIAAGDTYQVNLTTALQAQLLASPYELYEALLAQQPVDYAAILHLHGQHILSLSPELLFRVNPPEHPTSQRQVLTRPMKGTASRGDTPAADAQQRAWLAADEKTRAEHVMIVDLLRNDLGRVCLPGTVRVNRLFHVEAYPTVLQMTSDIQGTLTPDTALSALLRALLPGGSVTGAPKRSTMRIIRSLEPTPRGVYTGAIFHAAPDGSACASVAIRTLQLSPSAAHMGIGGGVVADSTAPAEYDECLLKAAFLRPASEAPRLIETLLWDGAAFPHLHLHLERLERSSRALSFSFDRTATCAALHARSNTFRPGIHQRVRLLLHADGTCNIEASELAGPMADLRVRISRHRVDSSDPWLRHKTTNRAFYNREWDRAQADGYDEVLFLNERGELTEGAMSTVFLQLDRQLYTPPLTCGVLPGILRTHLLATSSGVSERILTLKDLALAQNAYAGSALRGLRSIAHVHAEAAPTS